LLALAAAALARLVFGPLDKDAYTSSGMTAGGLGLLVGFGAGAWLVLRDGGSAAGPMLAWLWVGALIVLACLFWVVIQ